jgi:hypothetical protein
METVANRLLWSARLLGLSIVILLASYRSDSRSLAGEPCRVTGNEVIRVAYPRYVPSDPVRISGEGFAPSCDVTVAVKRPDGSVATGDDGATPGSDGVTTDDDGTFSYVYNLTDQNGAYSVEAQGASASFTAAPTFRPTPTTTIRGGP